MRWVMVITLLIISNDVFGQRYTSEELDLLVKEGQIVENLLTKERYEVILIGKYEELQELLAQMQKPIDDYYEENGGMRGSSYSYPMPGLGRDRTDIITGQVLEDDDEKWSLRTDIWMFLYSEKTEKIGSIAYIRPHRAVRIDEICYKFKNVSVDVCNE